MNAYRYRITVEAVGGPQDRPTLSEPLRFQVQNHDDLLQIAARVREKTLLGSDDSAALAIGLKLLSEVVLEHRSHPLFEPLMTPLRSFTKQLKATPPPGTEPQPEAADSAQAGHETA